MKEKILTILRTIEQGYNCRTYFVGGCVRDEILGIPNHDYDIEILGEEKPNREALTRLLGQFGRVHSCGESFETTKLYLNNGDIECDFSFSEYEKVQQAARRRDFTINSIYQCPFTKVYFDMLGGIPDIKAGRLRVCCETSIQNDPLRVLRGMRFTSRFGLNKVDSTSYWHMRQAYAQYKFIAKERVYGEWWKWAIQSIKPSLGLVLLLKTNWMRHYPELAALDGIPQDPGYHPEGNALIHTFHVCDAMQKICERENIHGDDRAVFMFAALTHDFGKATTTKFEAGKWRSKGHDEASVPLAESFLESINIPRRIRERIAPLVREHMWPTWITQTSRTIRRLKSRLGPATFGELLLLMEADRSGRPPLPATKIENYDSLLSLSETIDDKIIPIITGWDIINELGINDGKQIGKIKADVFNLQLEEEITTKEQGLEWLRRTFKS